MCMRCSGAVLRLSNRHNELSGKEWDLAMSNEVCFGGRASFHGATKLGVTKHLQAVAVV